MVSLLTFGRKWIAQATTPKERSVREYAFLYMKWLVFTGMRVDETLMVRVEDVQIHRANPPQYPEDCLFVKVKGGKLRYLKGATEMIGLAGAVHAFEQFKLLTPNIQPKDLLFPINPRKTIHELLDAAGLLLGDGGQRRTAKSFRHTYIMSRLLIGVDVYVLAQNCRTSVKMIQSHYGSYLNARMKRAELSKLLSSAK
jgi:integrase